MSEAQAAVTERGGFPWRELFILVIGPFMAILDGSIVNVAVPKLMAVFGVGTDQVQWVLTAYLLTSGVVIPVSGYLGDVLGYRRMYILSLAAFTLGSFLCSMAWSNTSLVVARVCQALGGGMLVPISMGMLFKVIPRGQMGMAMGIWGISAMMAPTIGPTLGGYLVDQLSWHMIFLINLPVGLLGMFLAAVFLRETPLLKARFDLVGCLLCGAGCFAVLLALSEGQDKGWTSQYIVTLLVSAFFLLLLFVLWELQAEQPMLDVRLLANPVFAASLLTTAVVTIGLFGGLFLIPIFTQNLLGLTPTQTGLLVMPGAIASGLMMPISGRLYDRIGARPLALVGLSLVALTTWELHKISLDSSKHWIQMMMVYRSVGMGLAMMPISTAGMEAVPARLSGRASSFNNLVRQVSASLGIAFLTYVMTRRMACHYVWYGDGFSLSSPLASVYLGQLKQALGLSGDAAAGAFALVVQRQAMASAIADCFIVSTLMVVVAIPLTLLLGKKQKVARGPGLGAGAR
ncbi:DHA2 family efflux MFS transporter permease subunit [Desulfofundulus sp.]|uniref:DHA2 family efflux MFS transporter permease subunit n=1 Tax=Desulfofundulus sp. TaxID=2282750 RepID=UPI003C709A8C